MNKYIEDANVFEVDNNQLITILHIPEGSCSTGVLIIVGGPQTRIGSHRQFILLARFLAQQGYPVMRFDYRGMGDSDGENANFENAAADIKAALDYFFCKQVHLKKVVIWGLCDAASAALMYAVDDSRVSKMVLLNPWVRTEEGRAKAYLKHYYLQRLMNKSFWTKLFSGRVDIKETTTSFLELVKKLNKNEQSTNSGSILAETDNKPSLPVRMARGLKRFNGNVIIILSGNQDYVADEFRELIKSSKDWKRLIKRKNVKIITLPEANHTFSQQTWRSKVEKITLDYLQKHD